MSEIKNTFSKDLLNFDKTKEAEKNILDKAKSKLLLIKQEVFYKEQAIVNKVFESVFQEYYGNDYDSEALQRSIKFIDGKDLKKDFQVKEKEFQFAKNVGDNVTKFNFNEDDVENLSSFRNREFLMNSSQKTRVFFMESNYGIDDLQKAEEEQLGDIDNTQESWGSDLTKVNIEFFNLKKENNGKRIEDYSDPKEVYKIAKNRANQQFDRIYKKEILPKIAKKYLG